MKYLAALAVAAACVTPPIHFGAGKSAREAQHDRLSELLPPSLDMAKQWTGELRTAKLRVWADDDFRAQNVNWRQTVGEELEYANAVLEPVLGVHVFAEYRDWDYRAPAGSTLDDVLTALAQRDPGDDVLSVVGLTSSLSLVTATFEQLGLAQLAGHHAVLRGYADLEERAAFERAFPDLPVDERAAALEARRRHKTTVLLLHELGHNLGIDHDPAPGTIMNALYSDQATALGDHARQVALATLDARLNHREVAAAPPPVLPPPRKLHREMTVRIAADGALALDGKDVGPGDLEGDLSVAIALDRDLALTLQVTRATPHDVVVRFIDHAKALGVKTISLSVAAE
jgi:biopolymer transport protein ExbD